jgi:hypothetical protein
MNPFSPRSYNWTYEDDTTRVEAGWRVGFAASDCEPRGGGFTCRGLSGEDPSLGNALTDTYAVVSLEGGAWVVSGVEGNMLEEEKARLIGFTLPYAGEPSHWEFPAVGVWQQEHPYLEMVALWVGPYPTSAPGSECEVRFFEGTRELRDEKTTFFQAPPNREFERGGWLRGLRTPKTADGAEVECHQRSPQPPADEADQKRTPGPIVTGGYRFSDIVLQPDREPGRWTVQYTVDWEDEDHFPGGVQCVWEISDDAGKVLSKYEMGLSMLGPGPHRSDEGRADIPGEPTTVSVSCRKGETDDAASLEISNVRVGPDEGAGEIVPPDQENILRVSYHHRWTGKYTGSESWAFRCHVFVRDSSGSLLFSSEEVTISGGRPEAPGAFRFEVEPGVVDRAVAAEIDCVSFE